MASVLLLLVAVVSGHARGAGAFTGNPGISALHSSLGSRMGFCRRLAPLVGPGEGLLPGGRRKGEDGLAGTAMQIKVQNDKKRDNDGFQRWWDPAWRSLRVAELKNPEKQFDEEHIKMAKLMGITPEELAKTMSNTANAKIDDSEYSLMMKNCVKAAKAGDLGGMRDALDLLQKMEEVGIKPEVDTYNSVLSACGQAADGNYRPCSVNDTAVFGEFVEKSVQLLQFSGGRLSSKQFSLKWKKRYPDLPLQKFLRGLRGGKRSVSDLLKQSPRFEVVAGPKVSDNRPFGPSSIKLVTQGAPKKGQAKQKTAQQSSSSTNPTYTKHDATAMSWVENGLLFLAQMKKNRIKPNARTYNTIISLCARAASAPGGEAATPRAFELLNEMRKASLPPELATYNALLALCAASGDSTKGEEVMDFLKGDGLAPDSYTFSSLMRLRGAGEGGFDSAVAVLGEMKDAGVEARVEHYNTLLSLARRASKGAEQAVEGARKVWAMLNDGNKPTVASYTSMLAALESGAKYGVEGCTEEAKSLLSEMREAGMGGGAEALKATTAVIGTVSRGGRVEGEGEGILEGLGERGGKADVKAYAALIRSIAREAQREGADGVARAKALVKKMRGQGLKPDLEVYTAWAEATARAARAPGGRVMVGESFKIIQEMRQNGVAPDTVFYNVIISAHAWAAEAGAPRMFEGAMHVLDGFMLGNPGCLPNLETYNSLITVASRSCRAKKPQWRGLEDCLVAFEKLQDAEMKPNTRTLNALMLGARNAEQVELVFKIGRDNGIPEDSATYSIAIGAVGADRGLELLGECPSELRNQRVYVPCIKALAKAGRGKEALGLVAKADADGVRLNAHMYSSLLYAAEKEGEREQAVSLVERLRGEGLDTKGILAAQIEKMGL